MMKGITWGDCMSVDYRMRRIRNIIKRFDKKEAANIGDTVAAFDAIKVEVAWYFRTEGKGDV